MVSQSQTLDLEIRSKKQRQNEINLVDGDLTDEQQTELTALSGEIANLERRYAAAVNVESEQADKAKEMFGSDDGESLELRNMVGQARLGNIVRSIASQSLVTGVEAELASRFAGVGEGVGIPLDMFMPDGQMLEQRAIATVAGDEGIDQKSIIAQIFPMSVLPFLGVSSPSAGVGDEGYPVITTGVTAGSAAAAGTVAESTAALTITKIEPRRFTGSFRINREQLAQVAGIESALRANLNAAIMDELDDYAMTDATVGMLGGGLAEREDATTETTYALYRSEVLHAVDGVYATGPSDLRMVWGADTMRHAAGETFSNTIPESAMEMLARMGVTARVSNKVPAVNANKQSAVISRNMRNMHAVAPMWSSGSIIVDPYGDNAGKGEIAITGVAMMNFAVLRAAGFQRSEFQHA